MYQDKVVSRPKMTNGNGHEFMLIRDLKYPMKNLNLTVIVLEVGRPNFTKDGREVRTCKVADKTGCVNMSVWDELGHIIKSGDILELNNAYLVAFKQCLAITVNIGKGGEIHKVGEFCMLFSETPNMSEPNPELPNQVNDKRKEKEGDSGQAGNSGGSSGNSHSASSSSGRVRGGRGGHSDPRRGRGGGGKK
ncbi:unnamed protein product [Darwinula stevensoni]|uniref:SOSS complex subunit B1 n=1 Tax=Darwinula stevensoni TaxID=69355 RepID=A0A7R8ZZ56_9CRUS|nr:unnamed protein product [Darwinula stevensoni]CAG0882834.1 unnamed protein product [Darwinula stevensoni]